MIISKGLYHYRVTEIVCPHCDGSGVFKKHTIIPNPNYPRSTRLNNYNFRAPRKQEGLVLTELFDLEKKYDLKIKDLIEITGIKSPEWTYLRSRLESGMYGGASLYKYRRYIYGLVALKAFVGEI